MECVLGVTNKTLEAILSNNLKSQAKKQTYRR